VSRPAKASIAAPPVSPEVAPTMVARWPRSDSTWSISRARKLHGDVLEGERRAMEQLEHEAVGAGLDQWADRFMAERAIGFANQALEDIRLDFATEERGQQFDREIRIAQASHRPDFGGAESRPLRREVKAAVACQAGKYSIRKSERGRFPTGAHIVHIYPIQGYATCCLSAGRENCAPSVAFLPRG
jgi:hypothetical protein